MRLKPSLFQLFVVLMVSSLLTSLLAACTNTASRPECQVPAEQRPPNCTTYSGGSSTTHRSGGLFFRSGNRKGSSVGSKSTPKTGRSGFGSFGRGSSSS